MRCDRDHERDLQDHVEELEARLTVAQALINLLLRAYDALLYHKVNYRDLPEYKDDVALDRARKMGMSKAKITMLNWLARADRGIQAAVRRKQFKRMD